MRNKRINLDPPNAARIRTLDWVGAGERWGQDEEVDEGWVPPYVRITRVNRVLEQWAHDGIEGWKSRNA